MGILYLATGYFWEEKKIKWYWAIFDNVRYVKVERRWNFAILKQSSLSRLALAKKNEIKRFSIMLEEGR